MKRDARGKWSKPSETYDARQHRHQVTQLCWLQDILRRSATCRPYTSSAPDPIRASTSGRTHFMKDSDHYTLPHPISPIPPGLHPPVLLTSHS